MDLRGKCFKCTACGTGYDQSASDKACRICEAVECHDCVNREGTCIPCGELSQ